MSVWDLMDIGTQEEIPWTISLCSWSLILMLSHLQTVNVFHQVELGFIFAFLSIID